MRFQIDTYEKAMVFVEAMRFHEAAERISYVTEYYPEIKKETRAYVGYLLGLSRETVSKYFSGIGEKRRWKAKGNGQEKKQMQTAKSVEH